jgi:hypothetical protein
VGDPRSMGAVSSVAVEDENDGRRAGRAADEPPVQPEPVSCGKRHGIDVLHAQRLRVGNVSRREVDELSLQQPDHGRERQHDGGKRNRESHPNASLSNLVDWRDGHAGQRG